MAPKLPGGRFRAAGLARAIQGNFDHIMGIVKNLGDAHNLVVDDIEELADGASVSTQQIAEHTHDAIDTTPVSHNDLTNVTANQHHNETHHVLSAAHSDSDSADTPVVGDALVWDGSKWTADTADPEARRGSRPPAMYEPDHEHEQWIAPPGSKGDAGAAGAPGATGAAGGQGAIPWPGDDGEDAFSVPGAAGAAGAAGAPGATGSAGQAGIGVPWPGDDGEEGFFMPSAAAAGASASGAAGGDLAGTYPNPTVAKASNDFSLTGDITPTTLAANTDDWNPTSLSTTSVIRVAASSAVNLTGIAGGADGRVIILVNVGSFSIMLKHDVTSTPANRFYCSSSSDKRLRPNGFRVLIYDATSQRWRVQSTGANASAGGTAGSPIDWALGDGNDGALVFDGTNDYPWLATLSGSTYTLLRDICPSSISVSAAKIVKTGNYRIFCTGTIDNSGTIHCDATTGTPQSTGYYNTAATGGTGGGTNAQGTNGAADSGGSGIGAPGGFGGGGCNNAGTGVPGGEPLINKGQVAAGGPRGMFVGGLPALVNGMTQVTATTPLKFSGGTGGGGGAGGGGGVGGAGGAGGGILVICADTINNNASGIISADGGAGANGSAGSSGFSGGGGGGGGGVLCLAYKELNNSGAIHASGGTGGAGAKGTAVYQGSARGLSLGNFTVTINGSTVTAIPAITLTSQPFVPAGATYQYVLIGVEASRAAGASVAPTMTGWGATWVAQNNVPFNTAGVPTKRLTVFGAFVPALTDWADFYKGLKLTFAATQDAVSLCGMVAYGIDPTTPVVQTATNKVDGNTTVTATLGAFGDTANPTVSFAGASGASTWTVGTFWTTGENTVQTPRIFGQWIATNDTTADVTYGTTADIGIVALELKHAKVDPAAFGGLSGRDGIVLKYVLAS